MAQKDKVKELIGRSLHSYQMKFLQKIEKITKKNEQQDYKISILTNKLDNVYPTKIEEDTNIPPIAKSVKLNKVEVLNNTNDINENIIPYLMDMDYRVVMLQLATEENKDVVNMTRLFGGTYEMLKRDILSKRLTTEEYRYRLADYFNAEKLTEQEVRELEDIINE